MNNRNNSIDLLKLFLILFVIVAHMLPYKFDLEYQTNIATTIHSLARCVVPLFFIITGYFISNKINDLEKLKTIVSRFLKMFVVWQILYGYLAYQLYKNNSFSTQKLILSIFYGFGHLWYLNALILGLILIYFTRKYNITLKLILAISLIIIGYILQQLYILKLFTENQVSIYTMIGTSKNFLFYGFPYILIGTIIEQLKCSNLKLKILFFLSCNFLETIIYQKLNINLPNIYISTIPLSIFIFKYIITQESKIKFSLNPKMLLGAYLIHFYPVYYMVTLIPANTFFVTLLKMFLVLIITLILFSILNIIDKKLKILF